MLTDYIYNKPFLSSERLLLRPLQKDDIPSLKEWWPDPSIYTYFGKRPGKSDKNPELAFEKEKKPTKSFHFGAILKENEKAIGELWVYKMEGDRMASVAYRFSRDYHGKGYATEALTSIVRFCFENTELRRLYAEVDVRNKASYRVLEKCGFQKEGCIRQGKLLSLWCDYYIYGILKEEYDGGLHQGK